MKLQVEILSFHPTPSGSASLGQVDFKITLQTHDGKDCPIIIRDAAILQDIVSSGLRLAMPRFRRGKDRPAPVILFTPRLLYDLGEQIIPEFRKQKLGQTSGHAAQSLEAVSSEGSASKLAIEDLDEQLSQDGRTR